MVRRRVPLRALGQQRARRRRANDGTRGDGQLLEPRAYQHEEQHGDGARHRRQVHARGPVDHVFFEGAGLSRRCFENSAGQRGDTAVSDQGQVLQHEENEAYKTNISW